MATIHDAIKLQKRIQFRKALLETAQRSDETDASTMREMQYFPYRFSIGDRSLAHMLSAGRRLPSVYTRGDGEF